MNWTADTADLLSGMFDARQRETQGLTVDETVSRLLSNDRAIDELLNGVSNNLGVYFLFCLFGLAILALFLCRSSMQALQTSLFFFVLRRQVWQVFMYNKFLQVRYSGFQSYRDDRMEAKIKTQKYPWTKI